MILLTLCPYSNGGPENKNERKGDNRITQKKKRPITMNVRTLIDES